MAETLYHSQNVTVTYEDAGLDTLAPRVRTQLESVLDLFATQVRGQMSKLIIDRGFFDTGATANSVAVSEPLNARGQMIREIGPSTEYAIYGELGWTRTTKSGKIAHFAGLHFARDALYSVQEAFVAAVVRVLQQQGR